MLNICFCFSSQQPRENRNTSVFRGRCKWHSLHARCFHWTQTPGDYRAGRNLIGQGGAKDSRAKSTKSWCHRSVQRHFHYVKYYRRERKSLLLLILKITSFHNSLCQQVSIKNMSVELNRISQQKTMDEEAKNTFGSSGNKSLKSKHFRRGFFSWRFERPTSFSFSLWSSSLHTDCDVSAPAERRKTPSLHL